MELREWEIWYTYSSTLKTDRINLESLAELLVQEGVAQTVLHRDGRTFWRGQEGIGKGRTNVTFDSSDASAKIEILFDDDQQPELTGFAQEAWYQGAHFRFNEKRIFHQDSELPPPYLRAFLGQCNLISDQDDKCIRLYPVVIIYETGVIIVELRTISPNKPVELAHFIDGAINLYQHVFDRIEASPGLARVATRAWYHSKHNWGLHHRAMLLLFERKNDKAINKETTRDTEGDFEFELAPLTNSGEGQQLHSFALSLMHVFAYLAAAPYKGFYFFLRGQKVIPELGDHWEGRPHIHLIDFEGQQETAEDNLKVHQTAFASMLSRVVFKEHQIPKGFMPQDSRFFSDYSALINKEASLWIWSLSGKKSQEQWANQNRSHLIYEHQATIELMEYGYMLHHRVLEKTSGLYRTMDVLKAREDLMALDSQIGRVSGFGEIQDLLYKEWDKFGVQTIRKQISDALALRGEKPTPAIIAYKALN